MSGLVDALVIIAVVGFAIVRQIRPRQISGPAGSEARGGRGGRWWVVPAVLAVLAVRDGGIIDAGHRGASTALLAAELLAAAITGMAWAASTRLWTEKDGSVWAQGTKAALAVWALGIAVRAGLYGAGAAMGVHQHSGSVFLAVAVALLIRRGALAWRSMHLAPSYAAVS